MDSTSDPYSVILPVNSLPALEHFHLYWNMNPDPTDRSVSMRNVTKKEAFRRRLDLQGVPSIRGSCWHRTRKPRADCDKIASEPNAFLSKAGTISDIAKRTRNVRRRNTPASDTDGWQRHS